MCAPDPNEGARQQAKIEHQKKLYAFKGRTIAQWNKETQYPKKLNVIRSLGKSRAESDIKVAIEKRRGRALKGKEKLATDFYYNQMVADQSGVGRSRAFGKKYSQTLMASQAKLDNQLYDMVGRGQAIATEGLKRVTMNKEANAKQGMGMMPTFGTPAYMPPRDTQGQMFATLQTGLSIAGLFASDERLKENIEEVGESPSGYTIYEWNYKSRPNTRYRGVIAQDVLHVNPMAVGIMKNGYLGIHYTKVDVNLEVV